MVSEHMKSECKFMLVNNGMKELLWAGGQGLSTFPYKTEKQPVL